jgi:hypothetical protein
MRMEDGCGARVDARAVHAAVYVSVEASVGVHARVQGGMCTEGGERPPEGMGSQDRGGAQRTILDAGARRADRI